MIPEFNEIGYLPPGIHRATIEEIHERFGKESEIRRTQMESLRWLIDIAKRAGVLRLVINGSFVTDAYEPNDVDCALLAPVGYPRDEISAKELEAGLPFMSLHVVGEKDFNILVQRFYGSDRSLVSKGMVEVIL